jgi:hypothetical protein
MVSGDLESWIIIIYCVLFRIRMEGLGKLAWFLANEEDSMRKLPLFSDLNVSNLTNMFIIEPPRSLLEEDTEHSVFTVSTLSCIFIWSQLKFLLQVFYSIHTKIYIIYAYILMQSQTTVKTKRE